MRFVVQLLLSIVLVLGGIAAIALVAALPTWLLWNWLMPELFGLKVITFWQALGVNMLTGILFKSSVSSSSSK